MKVISKSDGVNSVVIVGVFAKEDRQNYIFSIAVGCTYTAVSVLARKE